MRMCEPYCAAGDSYQTGTPTIGFSRWNTNGDMGGRVRDNKFPEALTLAIATMTATLLQWQV